MVDSPSKKSSNHFVERYRLSPKAFISNHLLTFPLVVLFLANFLKGSLQDEVDQFFQAIFELDVSQRIVTRSAICQARKKLSHYDAIIDHYKQHEQTPAWEHLKTAELPEKSIILLNRGYVSFHLLRHFRDLGHYLWVRFKSNLKIVKQLETSGLSDGIFHFKASKQSRDKMFRIRFARPLRVRMMKFKFGKETVYLMSNLFGIRKYPK